MTDPSISNAGCHDNKDNDDSSADELDVAKDNNNDDDNALEVDPYHRRVILLLDLDCFYAQCERIRLGFSDNDDCCLALLQWNSVLAVSYPARTKYGIQRGDGWDTVHSKSQGGQCHAVHVPLVAVGGGGGEDEEDEQLDVACSYESIYQVSPEQREQWRREDLGRRRYATEGKACLERYRVASRKIFDTVSEALSLESGNAGCGTNSSSDKGVVLEKASIDEFFLDVTAVCENPQHPLWQCIHEKIKHNENASSEDCFQLDQHNTVVVGQRKDANSNDDNLHTHHNDRTAEGSVASSYPALERGCQLAHWIRHAVYQQLGFTLSAGISTNKMVAKLAASHGKPNGQAVVVPSAFPTLMRDTKISKVRGLGGKLGSRLQTLLPPNAPPTMGSVAQYLSLPQLFQGLGDNASTAHMVFDACRGRDQEAVQAKTSGNLVKSITAFKSLPRSVDADVEDSECLQWISLLVQEVVSRVQDDWQRNGRYPRNCTLQYGCHGQVNAQTHRLDMKSVRIPFPPQRWTVADRVQHLMERIPHKIIHREQQQQQQPYTSGTAVRRKRIRLVRIGVCATEMEPMPSPNAAGTITTFFSSVAATATTKNRSANVSPSPPAATISTPELGATTHTPQETAESCKEQPELFQKDSDAVRHKSTQSGIHPAGSTATNNTSDTRIKADMEDKDFRMAQQLQALYEREHRALAVLDKKRKGGQTRLFATAHRPSSSTTRHENTDKRKVTPSSDGPAKNHDSDSNNDCKKHSINYVATPRSVDAPDGGVPPETQSQLTPTPAQTGSITGDNTSSSIVILDDNDTDDIYEFPATDLPRQHPSTGEDSQDSEVARRLQASYDRENQVLSSWESNKVALQRPNNDNGDKAKKHTRPTSSKAEGRSQQKRKKSKTNHNNRPISSFFTDSQK